MHVVPNHVFAFFDTIIVPFLSKYQSCGMYLKVWYIIDLTQVLQNEVFVSSKHRLFDEPIFVQIIYARYIYYDTKLCSPA